MKGKGGKYQNCFKEKLNLGTALLIFLKEKHSSGTIVVADTKIIYDNNFRAALIFFLFPSLKLDLKLIEKQ